MLRWVIYDNACAVVRMLRRRRGDAWAKLQNLHWVIDRLHFHYHKACQDPSSSWHVPGVDPYAFRELRGVDTEAAEQVFSLASRWQARSSDTRACVVAVVDS